MEDLLSQALQQSPALAMLAIAAAAGGWLERVRRDGLTLNVRLHPEDIQALGKTIVSQLPLLPPPESRCPPP